MGEDVLVSGVPATAAEPVTATVVVSAPVVLEPLKLHFGPTLVHDIEEYAVKDAGEFLVAFVVTFASIAKPVLGATNLGLSKSAIVAAAIAGAGVAAKKLLPSVKKQAAALQAKLLGH